MIRVPPTVFPGCPHHVVPRGRSRRDVFCDDTDRLRFIEILRVAARESGMDIWAYALMRNHVHILALPASPESISDAMARSLVQYTQWFNHRYGTAGELWHRRCHAARVQARYLWNAVRYVERNPVRVFIVRRAQDYPWSSAAYHCGLTERDPLVGPDSPLKGSLADWASWLAEPDRKMRPED